MHNIDRDESALRVSKRLSEGLGYADRMTFSCEDVSVKSVAESTDWSNFQVVFLAALVGMDTTSKLAILESLATKLEPGTLVVVRSAQGLRGVLYPVSSLASFRPRLRVDNTELTLKTDLRTVGLFAEYWL